MDIMDGAWQILNASSMVGFPIVRGESFARRSGIWAGAVMKNYIGEGEGEEKPESRN